MLNCKQLAAKLNTSIPTLMKMRDTGQLPPHSNPTPGRYEWREEDIAFFMDCWPRNMVEYDRRKTVEG